MTAAAVEAPAVRERPILFSAPMILALLAGRKTQTRRLYKPLYPEPYEVMDETPAGERWPFVVDEAGAYHFRQSPYGVVGDRLWVRETHAQFAVGEGINSPVPQCVAYRATCGADGSFDYANGRGEVMSLKVTKWTPSIFMRRWASRITLEVTDVRVERLQEITDQDAEAEGLRGITKDGGRTVKYGIPDRDGFPGTDDTGWPWQEWCRDPRDAYAKLWDKINAERAPWSSNPWVWAVSFRVVSR